MNRAKSALLLVAILGISCGNEARPGPSLGDFDRAAMLRSIGETVALPLYRRFEAEAGALVSAAEAYCAAPAEVPLDEVRNAWWNARAPWKKAEVFSFGPYSDLPWRLGPKIDSWPVREKNVDGLLQGATPLDEVALAAQGASNRGLPVIEYLLYAPGAEAAFTDGAKGARRCAYLVAASRDLRTNAHAMVEAWETTYLDELANAGAGSKAFASLDAAVGELLNRMVFLAENMRELKLGKPMGMSSGGDPRPALLESAYSGRSLQDLRDDLAGLRAVYAGVHEGVVGVGLADYVRLRRSAVDPVVSEHFVEAERALDAVQEPLADHLTPRDLETQLAYRALKSVHRILGVDVANALALTVTFNDSDGD